MSSQSTQRRLKPWPLVIVALAVIALVAWWLTLRAIPRMPQLDDAGRAAEAIARAFRQGTLTTEFTSYATSLEGSRRLQVASLEAVETLSRRDRAAVLWGQLALPEVAVRASLPVTYTYYLDLEKPWRIDWEGETRTMLVQTPPLEWNRPAVDVSDMRLEVEQTHPLRDEAAAVERLRTAVSPWLEERAEKNLALVDATAREEVEGWVRSWVEAEYGQVGEVKVVLGDGPATPDIDEMPQG